MAEFEDVLTFWYGGDPTVARDDWFHGGPEFDEACRAFAGDWREAQAGALDAWLDAPRSLLAYVILTDQIPRNIFREDPQTFATDEQALAAARRAVEQGWDRDMLLLERLFLYLPYEHSEDIGVQKESVRLYESLGDANYLKFAQAHYDIVARFGRFPHRNDVLGRDSTAEERAFLDEHGRGF